MPALLIKELPTIIGIAAILGLLWFIGHGIHDNGRKVERAVWLERDNERITAQAKELSEAMERVAAQNRENLNKTMEVINERDKELAKLNRDYQNINEQIENAMKAKAVVAKSIENQY